MSDKYTLKLKNFRSIRDAEIDIAPLTVVYGPNGSGKSSLIYGLLTLKNFLTNPNQNLPSLFSYPGISLGSHNEIVSDHIDDKVVSLTLSVSESDVRTSKFSMGIAASGGKSSISASGRTLPQGFDMELDIPFPYRASQSDYSDAAIIVQDEELWVEVRWDGINLGLQWAGDASFQEDIVDLLEWTQMPMELAKGTYFVPLRRGFVSPVYGIANVTPMLNSDSEVASMLATNRFLGYRVSDYMEMVADRQLHARAQIGTSSFTLDSVPRNRETPVSIVNEGFGVNQLAYLLTVALYDKAKIVLIEEPEIHLHPSMVRKLVHAMVDIVSNDDRRFVISTHSETFVVALLAQIAAGKIGVDDVSFILAEKEDGESKFTKQEAESNGQIQGGLESFIASEFEDIAAFLGLGPETAQP